MADTSPSPALPREISFSRTGGALLPQTVRLRARTRIAEVMERGCRALGLPLLMPACSFDLRGTTAGQAVWERSAARGIEMVVRLNAQLLLDNEQEIHDDTIVHEVAHLLTLLKYPKTRAHGREWQFVMRTLGASPRRTHGMEAAPARVVKADFLYRCGCQEHRLTAIRHKRVQRGKARYRCKECEQIIRFQGMAGDSKVVRPAPSNRAPPFSVPPTPAPPLEARLSTTPPQQPAPPAAPPPLPPRCPVVLAPTAAQLSYATALAAKHGVDIPSCVKFDRRLLSGWISSHATAAQ